jgi:AraC-like DNA-binding protein
MPPVIGNMHAMITVDRADHPPGDSDAPTGPAAAWSAGPARRARHQPLGLTIAATGRIENKTPDMTASGRVLAMWAMVLVERGHGHFFSRPSRRHPVGAGTLFILFPGVAHWYRPDPTWTEWWMLFDGPLAAQAQADGFIAPARAVLRPDRRCRDAFLRAWSTWREPGPLARPLAAAALHECLVASAAGASAPGGPAEHDPISAAIATLDCHPGIGPARLARDLGMPYPTLRRRFRAATGRSLRDYAIDVRLRQAQAQLADTQRPVAEIAADLHFTSAFYFSRLFHRRLGMSPTAFRRQRLG